MAQIITGATPIKRDYKIKRNKDFNLTIQLRENDRVTPKVTTGYSMTVTIRAGQNGEVYATWTTSDYITHTAASGTFAISVPASVLIAYDWANAVYEIQITSNTGAKDVPFEGTMNLY